jgi:hypothetical protein
MVSGSTLARWVQVVRLQEPVGGIVMDFGMLLTGFVFILMVVLMGAIASLDRRIAQQSQHRKRYLLPSNKEVEAVAVD